MILGGVVTLPLLWVVERHVTETEISEGAAFSGAILTRLLMDKTQS